MAHPGICLKEDGYRGVFLCEETVPLCVFPSLLIISLFITLKKYAVILKKEGVF